MQKVTPFLCFDNGRAEEAARFYASVFRDSAVVDLMPGPEPGKPMGATFRIEGQEFIALNGGPTGFSPAISFFVRSDAQEEIDRLWSRLADGGQEQRCGWVTDRFGVTWQIVPSVLGTMLGDSDRARAGRVMNAMLGMVKLDIEALRRAFDGR